MLPAAPESSLCVRLSPFQSSLSPTPPDNHIVSRFEYVFSYDRAVVPKSSYFEFAKQYVSNECALAAKEAFVDDSPTVDRSSALQFLLDFNPQQPISAKSSLTPLEQLTALERVLLEITSMTSKLDHVLSQATFDAQLVTRSKPPTYYF